MIFLGVFLVCLAIGLFMWLEKRRFFRTSSGGVQQFESYGSLWKARIIEGGIKAISIIMFTSGVFVILKVYIS